MKTLSGVRALIRAAHEPEGGGPVHGHTWVVRAWVEYQGQDALLLAADLRLACALFDHRLLPPELSRAEALGAKLLEILGPDWVKIQICRPEEGLWTEISRT